MSLSIAELYINRNMLTVGKTVRFNYSHENANYCPFIDQLERMWGTKIAPRDYRRKKKIKEENMTLKPLISKFRNPLKWG